MERTTLSSPSASAPRAAADDNLRAILMFLVVFAHLLEVRADFAGKSLLYQTIYTFHMPAFLFLSGFYARYSLRRIVFRWVLPYGVFQCLYLGYAGLVLKTGESLGAATPYWILWYLLVCIFYQLLLPLYSRPQKSGRVAAVLVTVGLALAAGYFDVFGYVLSLSRFFVFQPWFLLGYYCQQTPGLRFGREKPSARATALVVLLVCASVALLAWMDPPNALLYGAKSYPRAHITLWMRAAQYLMALSWVLLLFGVLKPRLGRTLPLLTRLGQNTLSVFLLHGFVVRLFKFKCPQLLGSVWADAVLACVLVVAFGSPLCKRLVEGVGLVWLERYFPAKTKQRV